MSFKIHNIFTVLMLFLGFGLLYGQDPPPPVNGDPPPPFGFPVPIDQDIWILVLLGLVLGFYFMYKRKFSSSAA